MISYLITVVVTIEIYALLALSLNVITGFAGQSMMGHAAFFGIGAYTGALLTNAGINFWLALPISLLVTGAMGALVGVASLRVRDDFLAITTIGINFVVVALFNSMKVFGASLGMPTKGAYLFGMRMNNTHYMILLLVLIVAVCLLMRKMQRSWFGLALASMNNNEGAAQSFGINVSQYKILSFIIGTAIAGLTGCVYAHRMGIIFSGNFAFTFSITILSMVVIGGIGTIRGPLLGAILLGAAPEVLRFADDYRMLVYGTLLVLMVRFQPQGLLGENSFILRFFSRFTKGGKNVEGQNGGAVNG